MQKVKQYFPRWDIVGSLILTIIFYLIVFTPDSLNPANTNLMMHEHDLTLVHLGSVIYRSTPWSWPLLQIPSLAYPYGVSILGTDSNPLMSFIFKCAIPLGFKPQWQFIGIQTFLCFILSSIASVGIFRHIFKEDKEAWLVVVASLFFVITPIVMYRTFRHPNLCLHWIILFAILLYLNNKLGKKEWFYAGLLVFLSFMLQPYFLPMAGIIIAALVLKKLRQKELSFKHAFLGGIFLIGVLTVTVISFSTPLDQTRDRRWVSSGMNLNALVNPMEVFHSFLPRLQYLELLHQIEGYNYMGFGLLMLFTLALACGLYKRGQRALYIKEHAEIIIAFLILSLWSLSTKIYLGDKLIFSYSLPLPDRVNDLFRFSARLFWPCWYLLVYFAIYLLHKSCPKWIKYILPALFVVQMVDMFPGFKAKNHRIITSTRMPYESPLQSPKWQEIFATHRHIVRLDDLHWIHFYDAVLKYKTTLNIGFFSIAPREIYGDRDRTQYALQNGQIPCNTKPDTIFFLDNHGNGVLNHLLENRNNPQIARLLSKVQELDGFRYLLYDEELLPPDCSVSEL